MQKFKYLEYRNQIKSGSCLLFKGTGIISRLIRLFDEYSHAALILRLDKYTDLIERVFLSETKFEGTRLTLMSKRIKDTQVFIFEPDGLTEDTSNKILTSALISAADDIRYDYRGLFRNINGRVEMCVKDFFCSEHVWWEWKNSGLLNNDNLTIAGKEAYKNNMAPRPGDLIKWINGKLIEIV